MSKPYCPLNQAVLTRQKLVINPVHYPGDNVFVADLSGQINLEWLSFWMENQFDTVLNYCIFSDKYFTPAHVPNDSPLGEMLKLQLPPSIPGIYVVELLPQRLRIYLAYGDIFEHLSSYLKHPSQEVHDFLDGFQFDAWVKGEQALNQDVIALLQAKKLSLSRQKKLKNAPWCFGKIFPKQAQKTIIVGAGIAGACLARTLAEAGRKVVILEKESGIALQGSGNRYSVLYPKLALFDAPLTNLLHQSYPYALAYYRRYLDQNPALGEFYPLLQKIDDNLKEMQAFIQSSPNWFSIKEDDLLFHQSLVMDMPALCQLLIDHPLIELRLNQQVEHFFYDEHGFTVNGTNGDELVLCNGFLARQFKETAFLGLKGMRGQMSHVAPVHHEARIYCHEGHFLPLRDGIHAVGASFSPHDLNLVERAADHEKNLKPWIDFFGQDHQLDILSAWMGVRGVSLDHLPIVGFVPDEAKFLNRYALWQHHANLTMDSLMPNIPGLYVFAGFGARGLLTIPYLAHYLTALMSQQAFLLPAKLAQALSPARFLKKKITTTQK